ncbi:MAG TPA: tetratricopeptide repeat protein [Acidisarcina sp.]
MNVERLWAVCSRNLRPFLARKIVFIGLLVSVAIPGLTVPGLGQSGSRTEPLQQIEAAQKIQAALGTRDFAEALRLTQSALPHFPRDAKLWTMQGIAFSGLGQIHEALTAYDKALSIKPDYLPALQGAAQLEYELGSAHAIPLLERILRLQPGDPTSHAMLAVLAYKQHDCATALEHFAASLQVVSTHPGALSAYGRCLMNLDRPADAVPVFQQIVTQLPDDSHARYELAAAQIAAHQDKDAEETLQPLLKVTTPDPDTLDLASSAYEEAGDTPKAVELLHQAIVASPQNSKYYLHFATLSFNHQSFQVGIDMVDVGLKENPSEASLYVARGVLYIQLGQFDKGEADFQTAIRLDPTQASGAVAQGMAQIQQSNLDDALATVKAQLESHPAEAFLYYLKAQILIQKGAAAGSPDFNEAIAAATRATQIQPDFVLPRDILGNLYLKSGKLDLAIEQCRLAIRGNPSDQEALYHLIQALRQSGNGSKQEMAELVQRLSDLRQQSREREATANKYKIYEPGQNRPATSQH